MTAERRSKSFGSLFKGCGIPKGKALGRRPQTEKYLALEALRKG